MWLSRMAPALIVTTLALSPAPLTAAERLCDSSYQNCRSGLLTLIKNERIGIDVTFWFMEDARYTTELIARWKAGVPVRVLIDTKANPSYPNNVTRINALKDAGIPIRRVNSRYLHWKTMIFAGQNVAQFGSANYSPHAFVPQEPLVNFIDESVLFTDDPVVVNSFKRKFDDYWVDTSAFANYANVRSTPTRSYPLYSLDPNLNFPPHQDFGARSVNRYNAESIAIDAFMYRITDGRHTDALVAARRRGVPVRLIVEQKEYRDAKRWRHSYNVDRLIAAGISVRQRSHKGWHHLKLTLLRGQQMAIFGSQNWAHTAGQYEHNYFTRKSWIYSWFRDRFQRSWNSTSETVPFVPLPPTTPAYVAPASGATGQPLTVTLRWKAGYWAHKYDIYFGTSSTPLRVAANVLLGNSTSSTDYKKYTVSNLRPGTTYYWRIVSKTMANKTRSGAVWSFRTQ